MVKECLKLSESTVFSAIRENLVLKKTVIKKSTKVIQASITLQIIAFCIILPFDESINSITFVVNLNFRPKSCPI